MHVALTAVKNHAIAMSGIMHVNPNPNEEHYRAYLVSK